MRAVRVMRDMNMLHKRRQRLSSRLDEGFLNSSGGREPLPQEYTGRCFSCESTSV